MSIATEIEALQTNLASAKTAVQTKGGTVGDTGLAGLADEIATIPSGGGVGIPRDLDNNGKLIFPTSSTFVLDNSVKDIGLRTFQYAFSADENLQTADLSSLTSLSGDYGMAYSFNGCSNLTSVDFKNLETITGTYVLQYCFQNCQQLSSVNFSKLTSIVNSGISQAFRNCKLLNNIEFPLLTTLTSRAFQYTFYNSNYQGNITIRFTSLTHIEDEMNVFESMLYGHNNSVIYFPALTSSSFGSGLAQFKSMLSGAENTVLHFPTALQTKISSMTGYPSFGGNNTTVLFDL